MKKLSILIVLFSICTALFGQNTERKFQVIIPSEKLVVEGDRIELKTGAAEVVVRENIKVRQATADEISQAENAFFDQPTTPNDNGDGNREANYCLKSLGNGLYEVGLCGEVSHVQQFGNEYRIQCRGTQGLCVVIAVVWIPRF